MSLPAEELTALLDEVAETNVAQLQAIKAASDERNAARAEAETYKKKANDLQKRLDELTKNPPIKSASSFIAPLSASIADSLCKRGLLDEADKEEWRTQVGEDPYMLKVAFDNLASRVPVIPPSRGSPIKDPALPFSGSKSASGEVSWFDQAA